MSGIYGTTAWRHARDAALRRDANRCTVSRWLGGVCTGSLHVHHIHAVSEGGAPYDLSNLATACAAHHPVWESLRRNLVADLMARLAAPRCTHRHVSAAARAQCERQMARRRIAA
jgi:hypothetical protein